MGGALQLSGGDFGRLTVLNEIKRVPRTRVTARTPARNPFS